MNEDSKKTPAWQQGIGFAVAIVTIMAYILGLTAQAVTLRNDVDTVKSSAAKLEIRTHNIETVQSELKENFRELKVDVGWIRRYLEKKP